MQAVCSSSPGTLGRCCPLSSTKRKRLHTTVSSDCQSRRSLKQEIVDRGRATVTYVAQILKSRSVNLKLERLPVHFHKEGQQFQYAWDGRKICVVPVDETKPERSENHGQEPQLGIVGVRTRMALYRTFVPEQVRKHYLVYMKWKFLHRISSSVIQVQCTQAMLQAIGVGARRSLPAAAGLNWVLKDGLGRLGRFAFSGLLGSTFDSNLKKVRFSTSVLFSLSLGLEMLTPFFPNYFLLLATLANIGRSIALAAYLATSSAIHKSFALGDNLADIAAKGQVQTVVADNLGLAVAVAIGSLTRFGQRLEPVLLLATFPFLTCLDLYAIYHELQSVHLQTINKTRLEIIVDQWLLKRQVPSPEEVSKIECRQLLQLADHKTLPLRIGALNPGGWKPRDIMQAFQFQGQQSYAFFAESQGFIPLFYKPGLLLWLQDGFKARDAITAVLQAGLVRSTISSEFGSFGDTLIHSESWNMESDYYGDLSKSSRSWHSLIVESRELAEASVDDMVAAMDRLGWQTQHILLDPRERQTYST